MDAAKLIDYCQPNLLNCISKSTTRSACFARDRSHFLDLRIVTQQGNNQRQRSGIDLNLILCPADDFT
jgi:hypothetical protein